VSGHLMFKIRLKHIFAKFCNLFMFVFSTHRHKGERILHYY
jgi:hypothetical protein